ncbi:chorismate-binding protein [Candidatus Carsonella ruddii]|uniref:chorismate-binding protein n=1 Tax=Carsonella ruddii TaxID=114186 RepID=UPI003D9A1057
MFFHKFKKILIFKKIKINSFIKNFLNKNFFFLEKKNTIFICNYNVCIFLENLFKFNKYTIITNNINIYLKKKIYNNNKTFRFLFSFFNFINFNFFQKNIKKYKNEKYFFFLPKNIIFLKNKNKHIYIFSIIKKKNNFVSFSKFLNLIIIKIKNYILINFIVKNYKNLNFFIKKKFFFKNICKIQKNINIGNLTQCVISNMLYLKNFNIKRIINLNFYNFFFNYKKILILTHSPEFLIRKEYNENYTKPIAGTTDKNFEFIKILKNKKEISEHLMLLDLSLNDTFKNNIKKIILKKMFFCEINKSLIHIVSEIFFSCYKKNNFEIIKKLFPAGTLSGSPKNDCIKLINILEKKNRFFYGGIFYYINKNHLESCIMIRIKIFYKNNVLIESGSGIIDKSINYLEWLETIIKKQSFLK